MHPMTKIVQWNCKGPRARHKVVRLLMNRHKPSCICLQELMLENNKHNLGREYEFNAATSPDQRSKGGTAVAVKKERTYETKHKNKHQDSSST